MNQYQGLVLTKYGWVIHNRYYCIEITIPDCEGRKWFFKTNNKREFI